MLEDADVRKDLSSLLHFFCPAVAYETWEVDLETVARNSVFQVPSVAGWAGGFVGVAK